jgi:hypothetical protein
VAVTSEPGKEAALGTRSSQERIHLGVTLEVMGGPECGKEYVVVFQDDENTGVYHGYIGIQICQNPNAC